MARLLDMGNAPFLLVKVVVGAFSAYILYRCSRYRIARQGLTFVLGLYLALMVVHAATGMSDKAAEQLKKALDLEPDGSPLKDSIRAAMK